VIPPKYDTVSNFDGQMFAWVILNNKKGAIGRNGEELIPIKYDFIGKFEEDMAPISVNNKWGYMDIYGKEAIPMVYDKAESFSAAGTAKVVLNGNSFYIDKTGNKTNR